MTQTTLQVVVSEDDAFENFAGAVNISAGGPTTIDFTDEWGGWRFRNVSIPQGAHIVSAVFSLFVYSGGPGADDPAHDFWGQASDNAPAFAEVVNDISGRARTAASMRWDSLDLGIPDGGTYIAAPSVKDIIQEIVNRPGWVAGNALALVCTPFDLTSLRDLTVMFYDASLPASLDIHYNTTGLPVSDVTGLEHALGQVAGITQGSPIAREKTLAQLANLPHAVSAEYAAAVLAGLPHGVSLEWSLAQLTGLSFPISAEAAVHLLQAQGYTP